jgi:hypothetical protein
MNKSLIISPCPHKIMIVPADEVNQFFTWLDQQALEFVKANNRYVRADQIAKFLTGIDEFKGAALAALAAEDDDDVDYD